MSVRDEWNSFKTAFDALDRQTMWVLTLSCVFGMWPFTYGTRWAFKTWVTPMLGIHDAGLPQITWRYGSEFVVGFVIPVLILMIFFKKKPSEIGLGLGDWRFALKMLAIWVVVATLGAWILSDLPSFGAKHPYFKPARRSWTYFLIYQALFVLYWMGWEYLWRGFTLFGTAHTFGHWAIFIQMLPFAAFHANKPWPEAYLSIIGGIVLGAIVWRCKSFWIAIPLHAWQMIAMDFFCAVRRRGGIDGIGPEALLAVFGFI